MHDDIFAVIAPCSAADIVVIGLAADLHGTVCRNAAVVGKDDIPLSGCDIVCYYLLGGISVLPLVDTQLGQRALCTAHYIPYRPQIGRRCSDESHLFEAIELILRRMTIESNVTTTAVSRAPAMIVGRKPVCEAPPRVAATRVM